MSNGQSQYSERTITSEPPLISCCMYGFPEDSPQQFHDVIMMDSREEGGVDVASTERLLGCIIGRDDFPPHRSATQLLQRAWEIALCRRDL